MRILAAADIHGVLNVYEWLVRLVQEQHADLLVLAGDLFAGGGEEKQREEAKKIIPLLKRAPVPLLYLMGNDDFVALDYQDERVKPLHGKRLEFGSHNFVGYQYTLPFVGTTFVKPEKEIEKDVRLIEPLLDGQTVFVTHSPAFGTLDRVHAGQHVGSRSLAALLQRKPVLAHIHGHIHESFGRDGNHFNVAAAGERRAIAIDLPSLDHEVFRGMGWKLS